MPKVLLATEKPFAESATTAIVNILTEAKYEIVKLESYKSKDELLAAAADCDAMIVRSDAITAEVIAAAKDCKLIVRAGAGVDTIDLKAASDAEKVVMNTPGQNSNAVAELVFGMLLTNARNHWDGSSGYELMGRKLGLHGCGNVSRNVIRIAKGIGMECVAYDPFLTPEQIEAAGATPAKTVADLFDCHVVSLHIPATPETTKSINEELISKMPKKGVLVNTARKEVVDEDGLLSALTKRSDLAYVADVIPGNLAALTEAAGKRVFVTPKKMGAQTSEANNNAGIAAAKQIIDFFEKNDVRFQVNKPGQTF